MKLAKVISTYWGRVIICCYCGVDYLLSVTCEYIVWWFVYVSVAVLAQAEGSSGGNPSVARLGMPNTIFSSVATCKKVLEWMYGHEMTLPKGGSCNHVSERTDAHEDILALRFKKMPSAAQKVEYLLRNQFQYLKSKVRPTIRPRCAFFSTRFLSSE